MQVKTKNLNIKFYIFQRGKSFYARPRLNNQFLSFVKLLFN